jgi:hypothetical protein
MFPGNWRTYRALREKVGPPKSRRQRTLRPGAAAPYL